MIEVKMICDVCGCEGHIASKPEQKCIDALNAKFKANGLLQDDLFQRLEKMGSRQNFKEVA